MGVCGDCGHYLICMYIPVGTYTATSANSASSIEAKVGCFEPPQGFLVGDANLPSVGLNRVIRYLPQS